MGWPLGRNAGGGSFIYHLENNQVARRLRRPPELRQPLALPLHGVPALQAPPAWSPSCSRAASASPTARGRSPRAAGSRCRSSTFPGGALLGCSAGFVNVPRIKGNHNAMLSGIAAAEAAHARDRRRPAGRRARRLRRRGRDRGRSPRDLKPVRNVKPLWSRYGLTASLALGGLDMWVNSAHRQPLALRHAAPRQDRRRGDRARRRLRADRLSQARRRAVASTG